MLPFPVLNSMRRCLCVPFSNRLSRPSVHHCRRRSRRLRCEWLENRTVLSSLGYSTFLGGDFTDAAFAIAADAAGNTYVTGSTASVDFPVTSGAFDRSLNGVWDGFVAKFLSDGTLAWSTYLGGDGDERGHGIAVDVTGDVYVTGRTDSANFPTTAGSLDPTFNGGVDAFVTKLSADGASLSYSTYVGGVDFDIDQGFDKLARRVGAITVDAAGQAYVTGSTMSGDFPTTAGAFRTVNSGSIDAFVCKLNAAGTTLVYSTYLGGDDADRGHGIAVDANGNAYLTGETVSHTFPTTAGAFQPNMAGGFSDSFVSKLDTSGSTLIYSSYLGGTGSEFPGRLALDAAGNAYVTGATASFDFPTTAGVLQPAKAANGIDAIVAKVNANGTGLEFSTHLGGAFGNDFGEGIVVDGSGRAYVTGWTNSGTFPVANAFQPQRQGLSDGFYAELNATGSVLVGSSYLGGGRNDFGYGIAIAGDNSVHLAGQTNSSGEFSVTPFPTTPDAFQPVFGGSNDVFVARIVGEGRPLSPGDTNFDGVVDMVDLNNVRNNFGYVGDERPGDTTGDGVVGIDDLNAVRNHFGEGTPATSESTSLISATFGARATEYQVQLSTSLHRGAVDRALESTIWLRYQDALTAAPSMSIKPKHSRPR